MKKPTRKSDMEIKNSSAFIFAIKTTPNTKANRTSIFPAVTAAKLPV
jgi:hypothetical protein